ncbi:MAG: AAC(3) family N-acetyltransferase [Chloroflexi bacterium]|nr:AAC(3) family N-acetyltransferase [Chloroflexota bacterium]
MSDRTLLTLPVLAEQLRALGLQRGDTVIVHSALRKMNAMLIGGLGTIIAAFDAVLGPDGTLAMPTHTSDNSAPEPWQAPPAPPEWWPEIRLHTPPYDPDTSATWEMGALPEYFRRYPGTLRSAHPQHSLAARGRHAAYLTAEHPLSQGLGEPSPYSRLLEIDASALLIGVTHGNNTALHIAEHRATWPSKKMQMSEAVIRVDGVRQWVKFAMLDVNADDFPQVGAAYEASIGYAPGRIGQAEARLLKLRPLVDFATAWFSANRT